MVYNTENFKWSQKLNKFKFLHRNLNKSNKFKQKNISKTYFEV